ncbi:hypothethical protein [Ralstonia solanacearum PSI07]|uniref:Hypothethical protein n=1 Tax=blood disease bacterium R229 TaxID=741978 RepID=G2ZTC9_9RALS|nr:hypothethical protein [Ralstonia solanacearum PSI07]CCA82300.1 hypothethical protein [blood disease bacterium R229]
MSADPSSCHGVPSMSVRQVTRAVVMDPLVRPASRMATGNRVTGVTAKPTTVPMRLADVSARGEMEATFAQSAL